MRRSLLLLIVLAAQGLLPAQSEASDFLTPEQEYKKLVHVRDDIAPLGQNPFGESISLYNGELSFRQTDISLPGRGPLIEITRTFAVTGIDEREGRADNAFGDWELDVPRISTITAGLRVDKPWVVQTANNYRRCTLFGRPPTVAASNGGAPWEPDTWWHGYQLIVPGSGSQELLRRTSANTLSPQMDGMSFPIVTKQNWMLSCLPATDNDPGEAFLAVAPDGTKYTFNHIAYGWAAGMERPIGSGPLAARHDYASPASDDVLEDGDDVQDAVVSPNANKDDFVRRAKATMLVTRVEDRFGNYVAYNYNGNDLSSIVASDGRRVDLTYTAGTHRVQSAAIVTASGSRTWTYAYGEGPFPVLHGVTRPDGGAWGFQLGELASAHQFTLGGTCDVPAKLWEGRFTGTITHPSGLSGTFVVEPLTRGRSAVPKECIGIPTVGGDGAYALIPRVYYPYVTTSKSFNGAGISARAWTFHYSPPNQSWISECTSGCNTTLWTDVIDPEQRTTRYTFSNKFDVTEGQLLNVVAYAGAAGTTVLNQESSVYAATSGGWPTAYGDAIQSRVNRATSQQWSPLIQKSITTREGDVYTWAAEAFDAYGNTIKTKRFSSVNPTGIHEQTSYLNDTAHWLLGLPLQRINLTDGGRVDVQMTYDAASSLPATRSEFGQLTMRYAFDALGQLSSFTDGNGHQTTFGNYRFGIPQQIDFPDGGVQSFTINDFGQVASSTDPSGNTIGYGYDGGGRFRAMTYPEGDSRPWAPKVFDYFYVPGELGIEGNHWKRVISQGDRVDTMHFDAMMQPVLATTASASSGATISTQTNFDWRGNKTLVSYPGYGAPGIVAGPRGMKTVYDEGGRVRQTIQDAEPGVNQGALFTTTHYLSGARLSITDPRGAVTTSSFQVFDEPSFDRPIRVQAPEGVLQVIDRDVYGNPRRMTQSGGGLSITKTTVYDTQNRVCRTTEPETGSTIMDYDEAGNLAWTASGVAVSLSDPGSDCARAQAPPASRTTMVYDAMNRVTDIVYPGGTAATKLWYTPTGKVQKSESNGAVWMFGYNKLDLLAAQTLTVDNFAWPFRLGYDANGVLSELTYPDDKTISFSPDAFGRPTQAGVYATGATYFANGTLQYLGLGNGAEYYSELNERQSLKHFGYQKAAAIALSQDFAYDANANIVSQTDMASGQRTKSMAYDGLNRLVSATSSLWDVAETYTYDALNNIRTLTTGGQLSTYKYGAADNLLSSVSRPTDLLSFGYDERGNVINKNGVVFTFDQANRLTQIGGHDDFVYDAAGRRVKKSPTSGRPIYYAYGQDGTLLWQYDAATLAGTDYIHLGGKLVASTQTNVSKVIGGIDGVVMNGQDASLTGWACSTGLATPIQVALYLNGPAGTGTVVGQYASGQPSEPSIASACQATGSSYRFVIPITEAIRAGHGDETLFVHGISPFGHDNLLLAQSGTYHVPASVLAPDTPAGLTATAAQDLASIGVTWTTVVNTVRYELQQRANGSDWATVHNAAATTFTLSYPADATYDYRVRACNANGCSNVSSISTAVIAHIPPAPAAISVPASSTGAIAIGWSDSPYATSYSLEQSVNGGGFAAIYNGPNISFSYTAGGSGYYTYRVKACNGNGCGEYGPSGSAAITLPPAAPPNIAAPASSSNGCYTVNWGGVGDMTSYVMQEQVNGGDWTTIANNGSGALNICGKTNGTYGYRVQGCNAGGCGPWSTTASVAVALVPATPTGFRITLLSPLSKGRYTPSWNAMSEATSYEVEETKPGRPPSMIYRGPATTYTGIVIGVTGTVFYRIRACNATGCSAWSPSYDAEFHSG
jgi:YD repeat-containing protein